MWLALIGLLAQLPGIIGQSFQKYYDYKAAVLQAQTTQAQAMITAQLQYQQALLGSTSGRFKQFTFILWYCPFAIALFFPEYAHKMFANLSSLPDWYLQTAITLLFSVWGIGVAGDIITRVFTNLTSFMDSRKTLPANLFYKVLRSVKGNLTDQDVKAYNQALEAISKDKEG